MIQTKATSLKILGILEVTNPATRISTKQFSNEVTIDLDLTSFTSYKQEFVGMEIVDLIVKTNIGVEYFFVRKSGVQSILQSDNEIVTKISKPQVSSDILFEVNGETIYLDSNSAEGKALQRIKDVDYPSKWVTHGEIGEEIDVDAINARLRKRGYKIQVSFFQTHQNLKIEDLPALPVELKDDFWNIYKPILMTDPYRCGGYPRHPLKGDLLGWRALEIDWAGIFYRLVYRVYELPAPRRVKVFSFDEHEPAYDKAKSRVGRI